MAMADFDGWTHRESLKGKLGENDDWLMKKLKDAADPDNVRKRDFLNQWTLSDENSVISREVRDRINTNLDSIKDQSHCVTGPFKWTCIARHPQVMMFSDRKRCRYCKPTEEHEDDHPLFWRGNRPIYNDDMSWK